MKKKTGKIIGAMFAVALSFCALGACGKTDVPGPGTPGEQQNEIAAPSGFKLSAKGVLSWAKTSGANAYEISVNGETATSEKNEKNLFELVKTAGTYTAEVKAVIGEAKGEAGKFEFTAVKLDAPTKPVVSTDPKTHAMKFTWEKGGETTKSYVQQVNGGRWITNASGEFEISATGEYVLTVKAKEYAAGTTLYLESDASVASDKVAYTQGPVLRLAEKINYIEWSTDGEYDSYNLWIDGKKAKENVRPDEKGVYSLIDGENGESAAITKTGEYDIQIEAVKGDVSAWSNYLTEVGTSNIGENELYSFDNRIAKFTAIKDGVSISNERYHGEKGHSLRLNVTKSEQLNFVKYAVEGRANDIDYRRLKKISYWVYVEKIDGYEGDTLPASCLPAFKWEKQWLKPVKDENKVTTGNESTWRSSMFNAKEDVPFGEWTKVTIDNVQGCYEQVFLLSYNNTEAGSDFVMYIDDICFEDLYDDTKPQGAEYTVSYDGAAKYQGAWYGNNFAEIDLGTENANKTVMVSLEVCGNANAEIENGKLALFNTLMNNADADCLGNDYMWIPVDTAVISSVTEWHEIVLKLKTNAEGKAYLTAGYPKGDKTGAYDIFVKNVTPITVDGTAMPAGEKKNDGYYQAIVGLKPETELAEGTKVKVSMDIFVTGSYDAYTSIFAVETVYGDNSANQTVKIGEKAEFDKNSGKWMHVSFETTIRAFDKLRLAGGFKEIDTSSYGNAVFLGAKYFKSAESFSYKNVTIEKMLEGTPMPAGTQKTTNPNGYYQSVAGLKTDIEAGTTVNVEMDLYITGDFDQYSSIVWVDTVWSTSGGEANATKNVLENASFKKGEWIHVAFTATVRNFAALRQDSAYPVADTSSYGNAVYLLVKNFKSDNSFNYNNVKITKAGTAMPDAQIKKDKYAYSAAALTTDLAVDTAVTVSMDILVTGGITSNQWVSSSIVWVESIYSNFAVNQKTDVANYEKMEQNKGKWFHVEFDAVVKKFDKLAQSIDSTGWTAYDMPDSNAVYILAYYFYDTAATFTYNNVTITAKA